MYCIRCGAANDDAGTACSSCGAGLVRPEPGPGSPLPPAETVPNYLVQSILVTLCCCLIPGIVAIVYAAQVNALVAARDYVGARRASRLASIWCWVGFGLGVLVVGIYLVLLLTGVMMEAS